MSAMSEAKKRANKKWNDANMKERYDRVQLVLPKGRKAELQAVAEQHGQSVNGFINSLIDEALERERAGDDGSSTGEQFPYFPDGEDTPSAAVGVSPTEDKESLSAEQFRQLSPDDWAVWAVRQDDESLERWKNRLNRSMRRLSVVDVAKRMGKLPEHERDILMGADPESIRLLRERDERERQRMEDASKPKKEEDLPF